MYERYQTALNVRCKTDQFLAGDHDGVGIAFSQAIPRDKVPGIGFLPDGAHTSEVRQFQQGEIMETRVERGQAREDRVTGAIERQTSAVPSSLFLGLALGSMAVSAVLQLSGKKHWALFLGQWAAPFLIIGNYNKMVKQHGSDATSHLEAA
jgi:hypothetical protein